MTTAKEWFKNENWNGGILPKVHPSVNVELFFRQYHKRPDLWKAAFEFLKQDLITTPAGKYPVLGDEVVANVQEYDTKKLEDAKWEAHKKFTDLQYIITGEEKMGVFPVDQAVSPMPYDEAKDVMFFGDNEGSYFVANPDVYFLFFPADVHRPCIRIDNSMPVKKLVIKIAYAE